MHSWMCDIRTSLFGTLNEKRRTVLNLPMGTRMMRAMATMDLVRVRQAMPFGGRWWTLIALTYSFCLESGRGVWAGCPMQQARQKEKGGMQFGPCSPARAIEESYSDESGYAGAFRISKNRRHHSHCRKYPMDG